VTGFIAMIRKLINRRTEKMVNTKEDFTEAYEEGFEAGFDYAVALMQTSLLHIVKKG